MQAVQSSDPTDLSPRAPTATATLGWARTSPTVQIDASEHWRGSSDHKRRWNHPGMLASAPEGRPRTRPPTTLGARCHPNLTPGGALSSAYLSLRWSPSVAGGAAITGTLLDVMSTQWRVEWAALAGCGWRSPSLGAMSDRRPRPHVQVNCILTPQYWEPMRSRYLFRVLGQWGSSLRRSVKVMGASYDLSETKTGSGAQCVFFDCIHACGTQRGAPV